MLKDVALQLGLRVDGKQVIGPTYLGWEDMCHSYLGVFPLRQCDSRVGDQTKIVA